MAPAEPIRITDLADPQIPAALRELHRIPEPEARRRLPLDEPALLAEARTRTGLAEFGDERFRDSLRLLIAALDEEAGLGLPGRMAAQGQILQLLSNRLRLVDAMRRHPEALARPIERPLVVVGLPRTGTSHLHNLLACHPDLRFHPYWESLEPVAPPGERAEPGAPDPRIARAEASIRQVLAVMPLFQAMHELSAEGPHEEINLLATDFATPLFDAQYHVPSWSRWYRGADHTASYGWLRRCLQLLQHLREGGRRWLLKSPQHLENFGPLIRTFPDAQIVLTHRDPLRVIASLATMNAYGARMVARRPDPAAIGRAAAEKVFARLRAAVRDRPLLPDAQVMEVRFTEYMRDELGTVERVLGFAGLRRDAAILERMRAYQRENARGKHGRIEYRFEDVGLDPAALRRESRAYQDFFGVEDE